MMIARALPSFLASLVTVAALFLFIVGPQPFVLFLSATQIDQAANDPASQLVWLGFYLLALPFVLRYPATLMWMWSKNGMLLAVLMIALLSFLWSAAPLETLKYSGFLFGTALCAGALALHLPADVFNRRLAQALGLVALASLLVVLLDPGFGIMGGIHEGRWRGVFLHKNTLGRFMLLGVFCSLLAGWQQGGWQRAVYGASALLCVFLLLMSGSATAQVVLVLTGLMLLALHVWVPPGGSGARAYVGTLLMVLLLGSLAVLAPALSDLVFGLTGRDSDLTGRTLIWQGVWDAIRTQPWGGYGSNVFWVPQNGTAYSFIGLYLNWDAPHAHNGLLELALVVGVPATLLFVLSYMLLARQVLWLRRRGVALQAETVFLTLILLLTFFVNLTEVTILQANNGLWLCYLYVALRVPLLLDAQTAPRPRSTTSMVR